MRKLMAVVAGAAALALMGCGADSRSCSSAPAPLDSIANGCTLAPNSRVTVMVRPHCESCSHTEPSCEPEFLEARVLELNTTFRECAEDQGCSFNGSCPFGSVPCTFTTPATGTLTIRYPAFGVAGGLGAQEFGIAPGGTTSCSTIALRSGTEIAP
jgi:hypothetical protein